MDAIVGCVLVDGECASIHLEVLSAVDRVVSGLEDVDGLDGLLHLEVLLGGNGVVAVAGYVEGACTGKLHVSFGIEAGFLSASGIVRKGVSASALHNHVNALSALDVDGSSCSGCKVDTIQLDLHLIALGDSQ